MLAKTFSAALSGIDSFKIDVEVINSRFLKPFDNYGVLKSIEKTKNVITIEDGTSIGGLASTVKELIIDSKLNGIKFKSYSYPDKFIEHGSVNELEDRYGFNTDDIVEYVKSCVK